MDLNPDQLIAMGKLKATDLSAAFAGEWSTASSSNASSLVVALDRFMAERLRVRGRP